jgi:UDP-N-acetylmuramate--alanine ligase
MRPSASPIWWRVSPANSAWECEFMKLPRDIGPIHFVGIGGIGMSGIAEVLANLDYRVRGSDVADSYNVQRLRERGITVIIGHDPANLDDAAVVVVSSAIKRDNAELLEARVRRLPVVRRAEMLAELMRLKSAIAVGGTHGKTTTTSMIAALLDAGGLDPTVINGGIINAYGTNARMGESDWMVVESDESDGTFVKLPADIAVVTNIDPEHLDHYGTFEKAREAYRAFVENVPFYGFAVMCLDHPEVQALIARIEDRRIVTYGRNPQAEVRFRDVAFDGGRMRFTVDRRDRITGEAETLEDLSIPMPGEHNVSNATAAIAVARAIGIGADAVRRGLASFGGVKRRFSHAGSWNGVDIYDDYGHHPVEIAAVLRAARAAAQGRVIAVHQPHRFTRLSSLFAEFCACFNEADTVIIAEVYPAGEAPIEGANRDALVEGLRSGGHRDARPLESEEALPPLVASIVRPGDMVVCLGAGSITKWANALPQALQELSQGKRR